MLIDKIHQDSYKVIEIQKAHGGIVNPVLKKKIEARLTGRLDSLSGIKKLGMAAVGIAAAAYVLPKIYNKIVGHHPGRSNKQTEEAIDSDFTAGRSYTRKGKKKESIPRKERQLLARGNLLFQLSPLTKIF